MLQRVLRSRINTLLLPPLPLVTLTIKESSWLLSSPASVGIFTAVATEETLALEVRGSFPRREEGNSPPGRAQRC